MYINLNFFSYILYKFLIIIVSTILSMTGLGLAKKAERSKDGFFQPTSLIEQPCIVSGKGYIYCKRYCLKKCV